MKIRSITYFCNPGNPLRQDVLRGAGDFLRDAKAAFEVAGYEVQTLRLATIPFPALLGERNLAGLPAMARELELMIKQIGAGYASLGPASVRMPRSYEVIPEAAAETEDVFFSAAMTDNRRRTVDLAAIRRCAEVVVKCAPIDPNGFGNLRFAALAGVPAGSPFFPAAYHIGNQPAFALGTEAADLAVDSFAGARTLDEGRRNLVASLDKHARALTQVAKKVSGGQGGRVAKPEFLGIDLSLAPFPSEGRSLGTAIERMGVPRVGLHGSIAAVAILTESIQRARFKRAGFSGLLLPVLEDATLAARAAEGTLTVKDLLMYSAVCGSGLDTVPLPGAASVEQISAVLLDLAALAIRLDKPLTARLMPIPDRRAGDPTDFDFPFFANSKVMALEAEALHGPLAGNEAFVLKSRQNEGRLRGEIRPSRL